MASTQEWFKIDLHMHSPKSNDIKPNDFNLSDKDYQQLLLEKLKNDKIKLFSITDHNIIDFELYENIYKNQDFKDYKLLPGIEINICSSEIIKKDFHMLLIFSKKEIENGNLKKFYEDFSSVQHTVINEMSKWSLEYVLKAISNSGINEFISIPHYNNKSQGIQAKDLSSIDKPLMLFQFFEDGYNIDKVKKSLEVYMNSNIDDFPTVRFSDWHNRNGEDKISHTMILGDINYPFETLRLAATDSMLRVSFDDMNKEDYGVYARNFKVETSYISTVSIFGKDVQLSPYQNTVIGGFGSGKSLLKTHFVFDEENLNEKYKEIPQSDFKQKLNNDTLVTNRGQFGIIYFENGQSSELYYLNSFTDEKNREQIEGILQKKFPELDKLESLEEIREKIIDFSENFKLDINDSKFIIQPKQLEEESFLYEIDDDSKFEQKDLKDILEKFYSSKGNFEIIETAKITDDRKLTVKEYEEIKEVIVDDYNNYKHIIEVITQKCKEMDGIVDEYRGFLNGKTKGRNTQVENIKKVKNNIISFKKSIYNLKQEGELFDEHFSRKKLSELNSETKAINVDEYELISKISFKENANSKIFKKENMDVFYFDFLNNIKNENPYYQNNDFKTAVIKRLDNIFENIKYDYDIKQKTGDEELSFINSSPGERSIMLMNILFYSISKSCKEKPNNHHFAVFDQPEDQMDNLNIYNKIVERIRKLKFQYSNLQFLIITHNPNIAINCDSENLIIANKNKDNTFKYEYSNLSNDYHVKNIINILEGGYEALKRRGIKLNVSYKKEKWNE